MSVEAMAHVFQNPTDNASTTLVWLAMADSVNDLYEYDFWMSNAGLQRKTGLSENTVRRCLQRLVEGRLIVVLEERPGVPTRYRFQFDTPAKLEPRPPQDGTSTPPQVDTQTQVSNPSDTNGGKSIAEQLWDALVFVCKIDSAEITKPLRGELNAAVKELKSVGASQKQVMRRAVRYRVKFPGAALTPSALAKHWATLGEVDQTVSELYPGASLQVPIAAVEMTPEEKERNQARIRELSERFHAGLRD